MNDMSKINSLGNSYDFIYSEKHGCDVLTKVWHMGCSGEKEGKIKVDEEKVLELPDFKIKLNPDNTLELLPCSWAKSELPFSVANIKVEGKAIVIRIEVP